MAMLSSATDILAYQFLRFLNPREGYCLAYLTGALLFALTVMLWRRRDRGHINGWRLRHLLGSRALWLHRSTRLDMKLYFLHGILALVAYGFFEATSEAWQSGASHALVRMAGAAPHFALPVWLGGTITTLVQFLVLELGYWAMHCAFHKIPALWEIHKVHHSAEVMTPLSEWRQHPIEFVAFANALTLTNGTVYAAMDWWLGPAAHPFTLFQLNVLLVLHLATFHHLRHSGVWIAATGWLGRVVHSPAHHQIHHSVQPEHYDRNFGYALSIWDWAFGTLTLPARRGKMHFGVPGEQPYQGLRDTLVRPLVAGARRLLPASKGTAF